MDFEIGVEIDGSFFCEACAQQRQVPKSSEDIRESENVKRRAIQSIMVTTTPSVAGYSVTKVIDVISAECVFGMNVFKDFFTAVSDIFGGRSETSQRALKEARQLCIRELKAEAHQLGANAVIGVSLDYSEFSGKGKSMLFLAASGTAVVVEKTNETS